MTATFDDACVYSFLYIWRDTKKLAGKLIIYTFFVMETFQLIWLSQENQEVHAQSWSGRLNKNVMLCYVWQEMYVALVKQITPMPHLSTCNMYDLQTIQGSYNALGIMCTNITYVCVLHSLDQFQAICNYFLVGCMTQYWDHDISIKSVWEVSYRFVTLGVEFYHRTNLNLMLHQ
jgi:uncharacterized radical SAM superfamily Fe-S cluster-containing enzyme